MAQPPAYVPAFSFTDYTANYPADQQPGVSLDNEFTHLKTTTDAIRTLRRPRGPRTSPRSGVAAAVIA